MDEPKSDNGLEQIETPTEANSPDSADQDDNPKQTNNKMLANGKLVAVTAATANKSIPIILKRKDAKGYEKLECSEFNENIDENKKRKVTETKELVQRSSSRKKIKKSFGLDFVDLGVAQYSNKSLVAKSTAAKKHRCCTFCQVKDDEAEVHHCKICRVRAHEACFISNLGVSREGYKNKVIICSQCRNCEMCDEKTGELFFCSRCNSVFHRLCDSNLSLILKPVLGQWQCSFCDTLDSLVGDSLTEEQRKKEIQRRKLLVMRKRLRKSDYVLEDGLCSIQQIVKQAVKKRKLDVEQANPEKVEIDLAEDELDTSKHILSETKDSDFWSDNKQSIDFGKLEEYLRKQRKNHNILSKHIKEDKKYFALAKVFIDQLRDEKFNCTKENFLKLINSEAFKRSFFELNSLNGLTKSSVFIDAIIKRFEKYHQNEYWKTEDEPTISRPGYFAGEQTNGDDLATSEQSNQSKQTTDDLDAPQVEEERPAESEEERTSETKLSEDESPPEVIDQPTVSLPEQEEPDLDDGPDELPIIVQSKPNNLEHPSTIDATIDATIEATADATVDVTIDTTVDATVDKPSTNVNEDIPKDVDSSIDDLDTKLVNELICEEPSLADFNDEEPSKLDIAGLLGEQKPGEQKPGEQKPGEQKPGEPVDSGQLEDENDLNEDSPAEKANSESIADQPLVIDERLGVVDLSEANLIENIPEKSSDEATDAVKDEPLTNGMPDVIDKAAIEASSKNESVNESAADEPPNESADREGDKSASDEGGKADQSAATSSSEQLSDKPADQPTGSDEKSPDEPNKAADRTDTSPKPGAATGSKPADQQAAGQAVNRTGDQQIRPKVGKLKNKTGKGPHPAKRKVKIRQSNNLADKLFKRACKYNLNLLEPKYWTSEDVSIYLKQIGFESEAQCFKEKSVDGKSLLKLTRQDVLSNFGIKLGKAVKIYAYVYDLQIRNKCNILFD